MRLDTLLERLEYKVVQGSAETEVTTLINDSRKVENGSVFVCISGAVSDGHKYAAEVAEKGAAALVVEKDVEVPADVTVIKVEDTRYALALMSAAYFGYPAEKLKIVGITGTKGKTTTTYMIKSILEETGHKVGLIGTIEAIIGEKKIPAANTTPESYTIHQYFAEMVKEGCDCVVMEVSSQGLMLHRTAGIPFEIGIFTNLGRDHIGPNEHKDFEDYKRCGWNEKTAILDKNNIEEYIKNKNTLQGIVKNCDEQYNLHIDLGNNIEGIIPRKEVEGINIEKDGLPKTNLCTGKVNRYVQFKVQKVSDENVALLSRREVQKEALNWVKTNLNPGDEVIGIVKRIENYGVFVEIGGGIVGLAHIEDLSIARIKTPFERLKIGQKINIMVKSVNREDGRIILSYKEMLGTWEENAKLFTAGMKAHGIVRETEKNKNGIFIELMPNLVGMAEYEEGLEYGQKVDVYIKKIDYERKKVKLLVV